MKIVAKLCLLGVAAFAPFTALAGPMDFNDLGTSTVDLTSNLEWLDLTETTGRTFNSIYYETQSHVHLGAQGWRFATKAEFRTLASNYFDIAYAGGNEIGSPFGNADNAIVEQFIATFGDTFANYAAVNSYLGISVTVGEGYSIGYLADTNGRGRVYDGRVLDLEFTSSGNPQESPDQLNDTILQSSSTSYSYIGSWLVRDYSSVPEPSTFILLAFGLTGLGFRRNRTI